MFENMVIETDLLFAKDIFSWNSHVNIKSTYHHFEQRSSKKNIIDNSKPKKLSSVR